MDRFAFQTPSPGGMFPVRSSHPLPLSYEEQPVVAKRDVPWNKIGTVILNGIQKVNVTTGVKSQLCWVNDEMTDHDAQCAISAYTQLISDGDSRAGVLQ